MHENVVDSDAGLTSVLELGGYDLVSSEVGVCRIIHDCGTFATELQNAGYEILGSCLSNELTFSVDPVKQIRSKGYFVI